MTSAGPVVIILLALIVFGVWLNLIVSVVTLVIGNRKVSVTKSPEREAKEIVPAPDLNDELSKFRGTRFAVPMKPMQNSKRRT